MTDVLYVLLGLALVAGFFAVVGAAAYFAYEFDDWLVPVALGLLVVAAFVVGC